MKILVTGAAGFIGFHVCQRLLRSPQAEVLGVDNVNDYYAVELKRARLAELAAQDRFRFVQADFAAPDVFAGIYRTFQPDYVVHLGAQAGVRYSLQNPAAYVHSNLVGFAAVLAAAQERPPKHVVFASSSSVYGLDATVPFREDAACSRPLSFYAATKQANEAMAFSYARNHGLRLTGLRFFTVYGPWSRPDMAPILFSHAICRGEPIKLYDHGRYRRDFTFIDDIVDGVLKVLLYPASPTAAGEIPFGIYNLGHNEPVAMIDFVRELESALGRKALVEMLPPQPTEMPATCADLTRVQAAFGYQPRVPLSEGLARFVAWYRRYYAA